MSSKLFYGIVQGYEDALKVIEASRQGLLEIKANRLNKEERNIVKPGACFVWEQTGQIKQRWTDGRLWSSSRYYKNFFTYYEKSLNLLYKETMIKKTFSITTKDDRRFQLINYICGDKLKNKDLPCPKTTWLKNISIPSNYYIKKSSSECNNTYLQQNNLPNFEQFDNTLISSNQTTQISSPSNELITSFVTIPSSSHPFIPLHLLECPFTNKLNSEDQRQLRLLEIKL